MLCAISFCMRWFEKDFINTGLKLLLWVSISLSASWLPFQVILFLTSFIHTNILYVSGICQVLFYLRDFACAISSWKFLYANFQLANKHWSFIFWFFFFPYLLHLNNTFLVSLPSRKSFFSLERPDKIWHIVKFEF